MFEHLETPFSVTVWPFDKTSRLTHASPIFRIPGVVSNNMDARWCVPVRAHEGCNIVVQGWAGDHCYRPATYLAPWGHIRVRRCILVVHHTFRCGGTGTVRIPIPYPVCLVVGGAGQKNSIHEVGIRTRVCVSCLQPTRSERV